MYACASLTEDTEVRRAVLSLPSPRIQALTDRIDADLSRRGFVAGMAASVAALGLPFASRRNPPAPPRQSGPSFSPTCASSTASRATLRDGPICWSRAIGSSRRRAARRRARGRPDHRLRRPRSHAGPDRRPLALAVRGPAAAVLLQGNIGYIHLAASRRSRAHADAGLHHGARSRRPGVRLQAGDRRGPHRRGRASIRRGAMITGSGGHGDLRPIVRRAAQSRAR